MSLVSLGSTHDEFYTPMYRSAGPLGVHHFATWPASRRLHFPFGRRGASVLPWTCTRSELMAGVLTEECARVAEARAKVSYNPIGVQMILDQRRKLTTRTNARQGWDKYGEVIA